VAEVWQLLKGIANVADIRVRIFGPRLDDPGGMASVERIHVAALQARGIEIQHVATYTSQSRTRALVLFALAVARAALNSWPTVSHLHVSQRGSVLRCLMLAAVLRLRKTPVVCTVHGSGFRPFAVRHPHITRALLSRTGVVTVLSSATLELVRQLCPSVEVRYLPNAVQVPAGVQPSRPEENADIFFAGEIGTRKGVDLLIAAWRSLDPSDRERVRLVLAGPPGDLAPLPGDQDGEGITWLGVLSPGEVEEQLVRSRCGVLPSRAEAMPMFILEVMSHGRPIITTDIEQLREVVGEGGLVVPTADVEALAQALRLVIRDDAWVHTAGAAARSRVLNEYSEPAIVHGLLDIYRSVAPSPSGE
jgi:glycosyltransferase involved in cell wall biosynthesis